MLRHIAVAEMRSCRCVGVSSPAMQRSSVVFPQPEAPSRKNSSPGSISQADPVEGADGSEGFDD